jgi:lipopolysaccharide transport system ATP-binding protein
VVDEVLAVGDAEFQKKAIGKMQDISSGGGRTVLFVSHNMGAINTLCTKTLLLQNGEKVNYGKTSDIIIEYLNINSTVISKHWKCDYIKDVPYFTEIIFNGINQNQPKLKLDISIKIEVPGDFNLPIIAFDILDNTEVPIFQAIAQDGLTLRKGINEKSLEIDLPPLIPGDYVLNAWIGAHNTITYHNVLRAIKFSVEEPPLLNWTFPFSKDHGHLIMNVDIK